MKNYNFLKIYTINYKTACDSAPLHIFENVCCLSSSRRDDISITPDKAARPQSGVGDGHVRMPAARAAGTEERGG